MWKLAIKAGIGKSLILGGVFVVTAMLMHRMWEAADL